MPVVQDAINKNRESNSPKTISYPSDIGSAAMYTRLTLSKYNRERPSSTKKNQVMSTIILPVPLSIQDSFNPIWAGSEQHQYGGIADVASDWTSKIQSGTSFFDLVKDALTSAGKNFDSMKNIGTLAMVVAPPNMRDGILQDIASQKLGAVVNPHLSMLFRGMSLRSYTLQFQFSPRTQKESNELSNVISTIRNASLPDYLPNLSRFALQYPQTAEVSFEGIPNKYQTKILKSAITGFTSDLSPSGPAFYPNGNPVRVNLSISLTETEIVTRSDLEDKAES